ncbi:MAG: phosphoglycerate mutase family protein [Patescibacteria group bacterium]
MMPIDTVMVRHAKSELNEAFHRSKEGDHSLWTDDLRARHSSSFRLSPAGRTQPSKAGEWIRTNLWDGRFDRYYVSPYIRTLETAVGLELPDARWFMDIYLRERDGGEFEGLNEDERRAIFVKSTEQRNAEPFFWTPPNGESVATICGRVDRVLDTLHRECSDKRVIMVMHGEMMWGARVCLERMSSLRYRELQMSTDPKDRIHNCQILHYTRRNPETGKLSKTVDWMRSINPLDLTTSRNDWERIVRPVYSNDDLRTIVEQYPRHIGD